MPIGAAVQTQLLVIVEEVTPGTYNATDGVLGWLYMARTCVYCVCVTVCVGGGGGGCICIRA